MTTAHRKCTQSARVQLPANSFTPLIFQPVPVTEIAQIVCGSETPMTLAISTDGTAYVLTESYSNASKLYSIDLQTGVGTLIGSTGFGHKRFQSMAYDHNTNQLFWARFSDYGNGGLCRY